MRKPSALVFDIDDVCVLFIQTVLELHNRLYNTCITESDIFTWDFDEIDFTDSRGNRVTGAQINDTFKRFEEHGLYAVLKAKPYVKFALDTASSLKYKIILLTARPEKFRTVTELNLLVNDLKYDRLIMDWDKARIINDLKKEFKITAFTDDKYSTCKSVAELCDLESVYMINMPSNANEDTESYDIKRITDIIDVIKNLKRIK